MKQPTETQTEYLKYINLVKFATVSELMRLMDKSPTESQRRLAQMAVASLTGKEKTPKYLNEIKRTSGKGRMESIYHLTEYGANYLKSQGIEASYHKTPERTKDHDHLLGCSEVIVLAYELERTYEQITIRDIRHEYDLRKLSLPATPDCIIHLAITNNTSNPTSYRLLIEIDTGEQTQTQITDKINKYIDWFETSYTTTFPDRHGPTVVFLTLAGEQRVKNLQATTEKVLKQRGYGKQSGQFFHFGQLTKDCTSVFLSPMYLTAFNGNTASPLLIPEQAPP